MKLLSNIENKDKIATGSPIDALLDGGVEKGVMTQFYGAPSSGKTNVTIQLAVQVAKNGGKVIYIDTEGGISLNRIKQITGSDFDKVASNIIVFEPNSFSEQEEDIKSIESWINTGGNDVDLIVLDSAVALYRIIDFKQTNNRELGKQMDKLSKLARKSDLAVVVTNQIYADFDAEGNNEKVKPVGGTILSYQSKTMVFLEKGDIPGQRIATLK
ncbi:MAG: DNA repair and recombination protein RadB, partial [Methanobacteriaceae archaeon]